jgi:hypothetical protein
MQSFLEKHRDKILGVVSCFDRLIFKGHLPFSYAEAFERFLDFRGILYKDFDAFVKRHSQSLKTHAETLAREAGRPYVYLERHTDKDQLARKIMREDSISSGLICVLATNETCRSFRLRYGKGKPRLGAVPRRFLVLYFYFIDREFGFMHVRLETWFPLTLQVYVNGHEWLARKLDRHRVGYRKLDNAFVGLDDAARTQRFADAMAKTQWPRILDAFARRVNPLLGEKLLRGLSYYWVTDQAEYATDLIFRDRASLEGLYSKLLRHATLCLTAEDVLTFLGRKLHGNFQGEVVTECKKRHPGARVKHRVKRNWIKMYDKFGVVLRIETVINCPREFAVRRRAKRDGKLILGWFPMLKRVGFLGRYQHVSLTANRRYLEALSAVEDPSAAYELLDGVCEPVILGGRRRRGLHPLRRNDVALFGAVLRGEFTVHGFRNRDIAAQLAPASARDPALAQKCRARVSRLLQLLRAHGLIAKIPRSRRYRLTPRGLQLMGATLWLRREEFPDLAQHIRAQAS